MSDFEKWVLDSLDLNDGVTFNLATLSAGIGKKRAEWISGADSDGAILSRDPTSENVVIDLRLDVVQQATRDLVLTKIGLVVDKLQECSRNENGLPLVWTPANATSSVTYRCLMGEVTDRPIDWESGWLSRAPALMIQLTCLPFMEGPQVGWVNEITNPNAETNTTGWGTAGSWRLSSGATLTRDTGTKRSGAAGFKVVTGSTVLQGMDYTSLAVTAGQPVTFAVWVRGNAGGESISVYVGDGTVGTAQAGVTLTTSFQRVSVTMTPTASGVTGAAIRREGTAVTTFFVDDVVAVNGTEAPDYFDGSSGAGYVWFGTANASKSAGPYAVTSSAPIIEREITDVPGDVPGLGTLIVADAASQSRRYVAWGMESRHYPTSSPPSLIVDSSSMVASGYAGATATRTASYSGASNNVISATLRPHVQAICGLPDLSHVGSFRPHLRYYASATTIALRLTFQANDGSPRSLSYKIPVAIGWNHVDLGLITIPRSTMGTQRWTGRIDAYSTGSGGETFAVDAIWMMPAETYGRGRATYAYQPGVIAAYDDFTGTTAGGNLNARSAPAGGSWATSGAATDFQFSDAPTGFETVVRSATSGERYAILGSSRVATEVGVSCYCADPVTSGGLPAFAHVVVARYASSSAKLYAYLQPISGSQVLIITASGYGTVASTRVGSIQAGQWYRLRLIVYASGLCIAQVLGPSGGVIGTAMGSNSLLATGGTLASGTTGILHQPIVGTSYFDDFYVSTPAAEPVVVNSGQSLEVRHNDAKRKDSTGVYGGDPPEYVGGRFFVPNEGGPGRKTRVAVIARRNDIETAADNDVVSNATMDSTTVVATVVPRYLVAPR